MNAPPKRIPGALAAAALTIAFTGFDGGPQAETADAGAHGRYFRTLPLGAKVPRADHACARRVRRIRHEPRPGNYAANHSVPQRRIRWGDWARYWPGWLRKRRKVTGKFTGKTDEILQWAACKWGIDEWTVRAVASKESDWRQSFRGDYANGTYHSFGIMQIRHSYPDGSLNHGGYPDTLRYTALNVDYFAAIMRSCYEGDFYDGGPWLYGGRRVRGDLWGCVGFWYSGSWYDSAAREYIEAVRSIRAHKRWPRT